VAERVAHGHASVALETAVFDELRGLCRPEPGTIRVDGTDLADFDTVGWCPRARLGRALGGVDLSEGQRQKTALARGSMRPGPLLFVLDEPTASPDAPSEEEIFQHYSARARDLAARAGAVTVVVSHRFSTVAGADLILVLEKGRLVEAGPHAALLARGGRHADLYGPRAAAYAS
jgi:hypothetical protein